MNTVELMISPDKPHKMADSARLIKTIPTIFKPNLNPKRLENMMFNPAKRRLWRMSKLTPASETCKSKESQVGFKGSKVLKNKGHIRGACSYEQVPYHDEFNRRPTKSPSLHSKSKFIYNLSLYEKRCIIDEKGSNKENKLNEDKPYLDCLTRKYGKYSRGQNRFDIQSIPATIQPRVLSSNLENS